MDLLHFNTNSGDKSITVYKVNIILVTKPHLRPAYRLTAIASDDGVTYFYSYQILSLWHARQKSIE